MAEKTLASERLLCSIFPNRREAAVDRLTGLLYSLRLGFLARHTDALTVRMVRRRAERNVRRGPSYHHRH